MVGKFDKVDKAFSFFQKMRNEKAQFTLSDVQKATGWGLSTVRTYSTKRWSSFLKQQKKSFVVTQKFDNFSIDTFRQHHSQKEAANKFFYQLLVEKSVTACVSAIEIYNKPNFNFREESFSILMVNAWELLLKAKILQINSDDRASIQIMKNGKPELTASGNPKTISIGKAVNVLESSGDIKKIVADGIRLLADIRDESVHFVHNDLGLGARVQAIGTASLKNFMTLAMKWFGYDFKKFNFYLMPVSFYHAADVESFSVDNKFRSNLIAYLNKVEKEYEHDEDPNFSVALRLETKLVKTTSDEAIQIRLTNDPDAPKIRIAEEDALKNYPHTYHKLCELLRKRYKDFKQNGAFNEIMRQLKSQGERFCKERRLDPNNPKSLYQMFYHSRIVEEFDKHYTRK